MDDAVIPPPREKKCPFCGRDRISCDSKRLLPLEQAVKDFADTDFGQLLREENRNN